MTQPAVARFKEFADLIGCKPSYVTELRKSGRLILTDDGRAVRVAESIARIEATRDPAMKAVADRHAAARGAALSSGVREDGDDRPVASINPEKIGNDYQVARAVKERYAAMSAKRDYEISIGKLLSADDVRAAAANAVATIRTSLEAIPDSIAPVIASETDESRIRILIADEIEHALTELARQFQHLARTEKAG